MNAKSPELLVERHVIADGGWCPNSQLPLLIYRHALDGEGEAIARTFEAAFEANAWPPAWRYTIFDYPHYHSTAHEVIGVYRGRATVRFGDIAGMEIELQRGDIVVIPAGVSHELLRSSENFHAVGAYPAGSKVDEKRPDNSNRPKADAQIANLPIPKNDPWLGNHGPLKEHWPAKKLQTS